MWSLEKGEDKRMKMEGENEEEELGFGEFWIGEEKAEREESEFATENSRMEGRSGVFLRAENHPMRWWWLWRWLGGIRWWREEGVTVPVES